MPTIFTARQGALGFASLGYGVFPLHGITKRGNKLACTCGDSNCDSPGQHPFSRLAPHGFKDATTDLAKIRAWPHAWLNYGIATTLFVVVDVDPRNGGDKTWKELSRKTTHYVPHTWQVRTGGGGEHILFKNPDGIAGCALGKGVEIKAVGGYIVGVGSLHLSGKTYQWTPGCTPADAPLADPPQWLLDEIGKTQPQEGERKPAEYWDDLVEAGLVEGNRNLAFRSIIGHLLGVGADPVIAWEAVRCINLCAPDPEDEEKLDGLFNRIQALELKKRGL
jgi:Bifunctional DNA primase/polymerase, N-terminal